MPKLMGSWCGRWCEASTAGSMGPRWRRPRARGGLLPARSCGFRGLRGWPRRGAGAPTTAASRRKASSRARAGRCRASAPGLASRGSATGRARGAQTAAGLLGAAGRRGAEARRTRTRARQRVTGPPGGQWGLGGAQGRGRAVKGEETLFAPSGGPARRAGAGRVRRGEAARRRGAGPGRAWDSALLIQPRCDARRDSSPAAAARVGGFAPGFLGRCLRPKLPLHASRWARPAGGRIRCNPRLSAARVQISL